MDDDDLELVCMTVMTPDAARLGDLGPFPAHVFPIDLERRDGMVIAMLSSFDDVLQIAQTMTPNRVRVIGAPGEDVSDLRQTLLAAADAGRKGVAPRSYLN